MDREEQQPSLDDSIHLLENGITGLINTLAGVPEDFALVLDEYHQSPLQRFTKVSFSRLPPPQSCVHRQQERTSAAVARMWFEH
jgi:hypothetical protein